MAVGTFRRQNLALFGDGELFNMGRDRAGQRRRSARDLHARPRVVLLIVGDTVTTLAGAAPGVAQAISSEAYFDTAPAYMDFAAWIGLPQAFAP